MNLIALHSVHGWDKSLPIPPSIKDPVLHITNLCTRGPEGWAEREFVCGRMGNPSGRQTIFTETYHQQRCMYFPPRNVKTKPRVEGSVCVIGGPASQEEEGGPLWGLYHCVELA